MINKIVYFIGRRLYSLGMNIANVGHKLMMYGWR
jgi:hypothetical protein